MAKNPTIRSGHTMTFVASLIAIIITAIVGVAQFTGLGEGTAWALIEHVAMIGGASLLVYEVFYEGKRTGLRNRDFSLGEIIEVVFAGLVLLSVLAGLVADFTGTTLFEVPSIIKGIVILLIPLLLGKELFSE